MNRKIYWLYPKLEKWMGGTKFVFECVKILNKDFELTIVCQKGHELVLREFHKNNIKVINLEMPSFTDFGFWLFFIQYISKAVQKLSTEIKNEDIIISSMYPMNYIASKLSNYHIQIIYEPFSFFYRNDLKKDFGLKIATFFKMIRYIFRKTDIQSTRNANKVLTLSNFEALSIKRIYKIDSNIIYEGVDTSFFYPRKTEHLKAKYGDVIPLLHSTGFDSYKGTDLVINSLPELKKIIPNFLLFITYTRENTKKLSTYKTFLSKHGLLTNVEFLQFLPYEELPIFYSFAFIYLEPGKGRSMSLSNKEAMACGTPVIRGNDSDEEVQNGFNGFLIDADSTSELVEAITKIVSNKTLRNQLSTNAIKVVKEKFNWEIVVKKIINNFN